jgi:hypothetical protein
VPLAGSAIVYYQSMSQLRRSRYFAHRPASCDRRPRYAILITEPQQGLLSAKLPVGRGDMRSNLRGPVRHALAVACGLMAFGPGMSQDPFAQNAAPALQGR